VAILGPRQCGKTTLARMISAGETAVSFFDLESPVDARRLEAPLRTLGALNGLVVVDEIQRKPELFEILRVLVDRPDAKSRYPGTEAYPLDDRLSVLPLRDIVGLPGRLVSAENGLP
jgi:predicted AAA+ superfamily ATPase